MHTTGSIFSVVEFSHKAATPNFLYVGVSARDFQNYTDHAKDRFECGQIRAYIGFATLFDLKNKTQRVEVIHQFNAGLPEILEINPKAKAQA